MDKDNKTYRTINTGIAGSHNIPFHSKSISNIRITNILTIPVTFDLYIDSANIGGVSLPTQYYINRHTTIPPGVSLQLSSEDLNLTDRIPLYITVNQPNALSIIYRLI